MSYVAAWHGKAGEGASEAVMEERKEGGLKKV